MNHFHEVARAVGAAVQVAFGAGAAEVLSPRGARDFAAAGGERREDRIEVFDDVALAADHQAVAAFQSPHAAAGADVHVVDLFGAQLLGAADVIDVVGVAAVDDDVSGSQVRQQVLNGLVNNRRRHHQPHRARLLKVAHQFRERCGADGAALCQLLHRRGRAVVDHALVASLEEPANHVRPHATEADHSDSHGRYLR
jgi:hypothetical protein